MYSIEEQTQMFETTLGQLNFFKWAIKCKIINGILVHNILELNLPKLEKID